MRRLLVVRCGDPPEPVRRRHGGFVDWFAEALPEPPAVVPAGEALPPLSDFAGAILTGSLASVTDPEPRIAATAAWLRDNLGARPVLGVCFGCQLLAVATGGRVGRNPAGPEVGTWPLRRTAAGRRDPLFSVLPDAFAAHESHFDAVLEPPPGAVRLAGGARTAWQAFRLDTAGHPAWGVQFHPEMTAARGADLARALGARPAPPYRDTPQGRRLLARFAALLDPGRQP